MLAGLAELRRKHDELMYKRFGCFGVLPPDVLSRGLSMYAYSGFYMCRAGETPADAIAREEKKLEARLIAAIAELEKEAVKC